jgi:hypothetical protein
LVRAAYYVAQAEILWIECLTGCSVFHFANAWEEADGEHIRVYGSAAPSVNIDGLDDVPGACQSAGSVY